jgi:hypothetical protein
LRYQNSLQVSVTSEETAKKKIYYILFFLVTLANLLKSLKAAPALVPVLVQPVVGPPLLELLFALFFWNLVIEAHGNISPRLHPLTKLSLLCIE